MIKISLFFLVPYGTEGRVLKALSDVTITLTFMFIGVRDEKWNSLLLQERRQFPDQESKKKAIILRHMLLKMMRHQRWHKLYNKKKRWERPALGH